jgi:Secretion system C-terminal sorting domain
MKNFCLLILLLHLAASGLAQGWQMANGARLVGTNCPHLVIRGGTAANLSLEASAQVRNLNIDLTGNIANAGIVNIETCNVRLTGTALQTVSGGGTTSLDYLFLDNLNHARLTTPVSIRRVFNMINGNLTSDGNLTILSNAAHTAAILNPTNPNNPTNQIIGNVNVQRYVGPYPARTNGRGYNYFGSPVRNPPLTEVNDDVPLVLNPAYDFFTAYPGAFPNFFFYRENRIDAAWQHFERAWESPASLAATIGIGQGFIVNLTNIPTTLDFTGLVNDGNINVPITRGAFNNTGWNLVGNPYPSSLDWNLVYTFGTNSTKIESFYQTRIATSAFGGIWASYDRTAGTGTNGGTKDIALGQGVLVRVLTTQTGVGGLTLDLNNAMRNASEPQFFRPEESEEKTQGVFKLKLASTTGSDETVFFFHPRATTDYEEGLDGLKSQLNSSPAPNLFSRLNGQRFLYNALPTANVPNEVPLHFSVGVSGQHELSLSEVRNLQAGIPIHLEDKRAGLTHDLRKGKYAFAANAGGDTTRFVLRFAPSFEREIPAESLVVYPNPTAGREIKVNVDHPYKGNLQIRLLDVLGKVMLEQEVNKQFVQQTFKLDLEGLSQGVYLLKIEGEGYSATRTLTKQ